MQVGTQLLDVMNEVSARLDQAPPVATSRPRPEPLDEMQAFIQLDPLLADLSKQYLDAKAARVQSEKEYGRGDGMTDMAAILEDSAWCAMQTRYMELRANRGLMSRAQNLMEENRRENEERESAAKKEDALKTFRYLQALMRAREAAEKNTGWWIMVLWAMMYQPIGFRNHHPSYSFNRLAA